VCTLSSRSPHSALPIYRSDDFETLAAATERIFPEDDAGPGAIALGVPYFIDKQLSGFWGTNHEDYMKGPYNLHGWFPKIPTAVRSEEHTSELQSRFELV